MTEDAGPLPPAFPFMRLPLELREQVYSHYFHPGDHLVRNPVLEAKGFYGGVYQWDLDVFYVNKQIYRESKRVWDRENIFVKIATPWPTAGMYQVYLMATDGVSEQGSMSMSESSSGHRELPLLLQAKSENKINHISSEGLVPIVCADSKAAACKAHHAVVQIDSPLQGVEPEHMVIMLMDDLPLFAKTWYYSALSYPMLNERLHATFTLRNPLKEEGHGDDGAENREEEGLGVPISLQKKLLLPFEHVKGLAGVFIHGFSRSVRSELARLQAIPIPTLQQSLESATDLMLAGDTALSNPDSARDAAALEALDLYKKAFHAIHILIYNRTRRVMADVFFHDAVAHGRYAGQTGMTIRVLLRLQLVARTVAAYNQLRQWDDSAFWGMRSINILTESFSPSFEAFLTHLHNGADVGFIYVRTGIAFWHMEQNREDWMGELISYADDPMARSERLWEVAGRFVKPAVREKARGELLAYGVPKEKVAELFMSGQATTRETESVEVQDGSGSSDEDVWI
ncbi:hypothetical protein yc1106_03633 [Curvularia clavata]|uniref:Uncharacterized protein n=1 Tax=Curvularia clavata TaxID=95742 RepID=A0A9Q9DS41_CURCL|nr:hypothetical protein yc1106_03633 [Curvularia clavata]